jgi:hypothetical protein
MANPKRKRFVKTLLKTEGLVPMELWLPVRDAKEFTADALAQNPGVRVAVARGLLCKKYRDQFNRHRYHGI